MILQSSWCLEVHANSWLSDLKVGKATKILQEEEMYMITGLIFCLKTYFDKSCY